MPDSVTIVRRFFAAWTAGDLETMLDLVDADVVAKPALGPLFEQREYRGRDGIAAAVGEVAGRWERFEPRVEDARQAADQVVAFLHLVVEAGGAASDARLAVVCTLRDGLITSLAGHVAGTTRDHLGDG
jgi:ketosteroid isomerase-like protein